MLSLLVLVIDDEQDHTAMLAEFVEMCGHRAITARTGAEAFAALDQRPDLILVDIGLPDIDGVALVAAMRAHGVTARIVATTGYASRAVRERAERSGVDWFLLKPFSLVRIREQLDLSGGGRGGSSLE